MLLDFYSLWSLFLVLHPVFRKRICPWILSWLDKVILNFRITTGGKILRKLYILLWSSCCGLESGSEPQIFLLLSKTIWQWNAWALLNRCQKTKIIHNEFCLRNVIKSVHCYLLSHKFSPLTQCVCLEYLNII